MIAVFATLKREFLIAGRSSFEAFTPVAFFVLASVVFALGLGSSTEVLQQVAPMAIWIIALLASLLSLEGLYKRDFDDGTLAIALIQSNSNPFVTLVRLLVHWSLVGLPVILLTPVIAFAYSLDHSAIVILMLSLLIGTPIFTLVGGLLAALVVGLERGGILLALLVLPIYVPVILTGVGICQLSVAGLAYTGQLLFLSALLALAVTVVPVVTQPILRMAYGG